MDNVSANDAELIAAWRRGERTAFGALVERYQRSVTAIAYAQVRDRALADDIAQDAFVVAWAELGKLRDPERAEPWLCGIARNLARRAARAGARVAPLDDATADSAATPYERLREAEIEALVADALGRVPDTYREALVLFYFEQRSARDVATALGIAEAAVHKRLSRGREYLAADVERVVARTLERPRTRKQLAAAVLAALPPAAIALTSSHARASTMKGTSMWKIVCAMGLVAALAVVTVIVQPAATARPDAAPAARPAEPASAPAGVPQRAAVRARERPSLPALLHGMRAAAGAASATAGGPAPSVPGDCADVAHHMIDLTIAAMPPAYAPDRTLVEDHAAHYWAHECRALAWSAEMRACALAAADVSEAMGCLGAEPPAKPAVEPSAADLTCPALAAHVYALLRDRFDHTDYASELTADFKDAFDHACVDQPFDDTLRRCLAAATSAAEFDACILQCQGEQP